MGWTGDEWDKVLLGMSVKGARDWRGAFEEGGRT